MCATVAIVDILTWHAVRRVRTARMSTDIYEKKHYYTPSEYCYIMEYLLQKYCEYKTAGMFTLIEGLVAIVKNHPDMDSDNRSMLPIEDRALHVIRQLVEFRVSTLY